MSETDPVIDPEEEHSVPTRDFLAYCGEELERRRNSEPDFNQQRADQAVALVVDRLQRLTGVRR